MNLALLKKTFRKETKTQSMKNKFQLILLNLPLHALCRAYFASMHLDSARCNMTSGCWNVESNPQNIFLHVGGSSNLKVCIPLISETERKCGII